MNGLMTAVEERIPIVVVVSTTGARLGPARPGRPPDRLGIRRRFDHAGIARAMGCEGIRVERPADLDDLARALAAGRPAVVDVVTSLRYTFRDVCSPLAAYPR